MMEVLGKGAGREWKDKKGKGDYIQQRINKIF